MSSVLRTRVVRVNDLEFGLIEVGSGPLALCLHGFPDTAYTWEYLLPLLGEAGFHAVAPFMRGYAPTSVPGDGYYSLGALVADAIGLHEALDGDGDAILIGHDWGAEAAYGAAAFSPNRWRRLITLAVPPAALDRLLFADYEQIKRFFYLFFLGDPRWFAETIVAANGMAFIDKLWRDWSPGYDAREHLAKVKDCLRDPEHLAAAVGYYRALTSQSGSQSAAHTQAFMPYEAEENAARLLAPQPTLYLHGSADGCIGVEMVREVESTLAPGSHAAVIEGAGHFLQLEKPDEVNWHILNWVTA